MVVGAFFLTQVKIYVLAGNENLFATVGRTVWFSWELVLY